MLENATITVNLDDYTSMVETTMKYNMLIEALFSNAKLGYYKDKLNFSDDMLNDAMQILESDLFRKKMDVLKSKEQEK